MTQRCSFGPPPSSHPPSSPPLPLPRPVSTSFDGLWVVDPEGVAIATVELEPEDEKPATFLLVPSTYAKGVRGARWWGGGWVVAAGPWLPLVPTPSTTHPTPIQCALRYDHYTGGFTLVVHSEPAVTVKRVKGSAGA